MFDYLIADKGYDSKRFVESVNLLGAKTVIPSRPYNRDQRRYDRYLYRERHLIECFIGKIKHYRRIITRFDFEIIEMIFTGKNLKPFL